MDTSGSRTRRCRPSLILPTAPQLWFVTAARRFFADSQREAYLPGERGALFDWSQHDLADSAGVGIVTVRQLEGGGTRPRRATLDVIRRALEAAGVEFIEENGGGPGVRLRKPKR